MKQSTYFALTIGPIYKTMALARKTRELWASSYLFSYLMEQIVKSDKLKGELVLPAKSTAKNIKAGLYPDHLILKLPEKNFSYHNALEVVIYEWNEIIKKLPGGDNDGEQAEFFSNYFQRYMLEITLSDKEDPIKTILPLLDTMEQKAAYVPEFEKNYLELFLQKIIDWEPYKEIFEEQSRFPSILEIAAQGLKRLKNPNTPKLINDYKTNKDVFNRIFDYCLENEGNKIIVNSKVIIVDDTTAISLLKQAYNLEKSTEKEDEGFHFHHKYTAIIQADGDNLSQALHAFYTAGKIEAVQKFSKFLMEFGEEATRKIEDFGGTPIYMGGDDLLFFAPVKCDGKTIFNLVKELDDLFENKLVESKELNVFLGEWESGITEKNRRKKVEFSISYGVSIGYHKYPLRESLETARKLLFDESKMVPKKNALSFKVLKHSGQFFGATWRKDWKSYRLFLEMLKNPVIEDNFLTSVQHKLNPLRPVLYRILVGNEIDPAKASFRQDVSKHLHEETSRELFLNRLNINFFNDLVHKDVGKRTFLFLTFEYLLQAYRDMEDIYGNNRQTAEKAVDSLYATLRFIQFIYQPDQNEEEE